MSLCARSRLWDGWVDKPEAGRLVEDEAAGVLFVGRMSTIESSWRSVVVMARAVRLGSGGWGGGESGGGGRLCDVVGGGGGGGGRLTVS